jgi:hypothetical protein
VTYFETVPAGGSIPANETTAGQKRHDVRIATCDEHVNPGIVQSGDTPPSTDAVSRSAERADLDRFRI